MSKVITNKQPLTKLNVFQYKWRTDAHLSYYLAHFFCVLFWLVWTSTPNAHYPGRSWIK